MSRARYYISFDAGVTYSEFWPSNEPKVTWNKVGIEIFLRYRVDKFRIGRTKNETVYDTLSGMFFDPAYFGTDILYKINILGTDKFFFIDPVTSGSLDTQNNVIECIPDTDDNYRDILKLYEVKYQDRDPNDIFNITLPFYYQNLDPHGFTNISYTSWTDTAGSVVWTNTGGGATQTANNQIGAGTPLGVGNIVTFIVTDFGGNNFDVRLLTAGLAAASATTTINAIGKYELVCTNLATIVEVTTSDNLTGDFVYDIYYPTITTSGTLLDDALDEIINGASFMNLGLTIVSTILWNDALGSDPPPNIDTYITANPTNDYVREAAAGYNNLWLARCDTFTTKKETKLDICLKDVMDILKLKLRMWWFIDEDGNFRIEHEKYFRDYDAQADLTSATYTNDKPEVDVRLYGYEMADVACQINLSENNQSNTEFVPYPVYFNSSTATTRDVGVPNLTTDIAYVVATPDDASGAGFMLLRMVDMGGAWMVSIDLSVLFPGGGVHYVNGNLSWAYVLANYFDYFADAETGTLNNGAFTFTHVKEFLKQGNIKFRMTADLDWKKPVTLLEGEGWIEKAEYSPETGMYKIDVVLNPYDVVIYVVDSEDIGIKIVDDDGTTEIVL